MRSSAKNLLAVVALALVGIWAFTLYKTNIIVMNGSSMKPTLEDGDWLLLKNAWIGAEIERGDMIVFQPSVEPTQKWLKRVVGLPGETITIKDGNVYMAAAGGEPMIIDEPYLDQASKGRTYRHPPGSGDETEMSYKIPAGHYFVLGDNRMGSLDSRSMISSDGESMPFVSEDEIVARVAMALN